MSDLRNSIEKSIASCGTREERIVFDVIMEAIDGLQPSVSPLAIIGALELVKHVVITNLS